MKVNTMITCVNENYLYPGKNGAYKSSSLVSRSILMVRLFTCLADNKTVVKKIATYVT